MSRSSPVSWPCPPGCAGAPPHPYCRWSRSGGCSRASPGQSGSRDFSRKEVRDCVYDQLHKVLSSANIEYVKWDMNRELSDVWSSALPAGRQGELRHRYVLGVYELQERLLRDFPGLLLENCASGGGPVLSSPVSVKR